MDQAAPRIVVVDDDRPTIELICELLRDTGYTVWGCYEIAEAYRLLERVRPLLVITDLWMDKPESGWSFIQHLRQLPEFANLALILCAADSAFLRAHAQELDALNCGVVEKPFNVTDLLRAVEVKIGAAPDSALA